MTTYEVQARAFRLYTASEQEEEIGRSHLESRNPEVWTTQNPESLHETLVPDTQKTRLLLSQLLLLLKIKSYLFLQKTIWMPGNSVSQQTSTSRLKQLKGRIVKLIRVLS